MLSKLVTWIYRSPQWFRWTVALVVLYVAQLVRLAPATAYQIALLSVLEFGVIVWTGSKHAYHYSQTASVRRVPIGKIGWVARACEIHGTQQWGEWILFALLWALGVPAMVVIGVQFVARIPFQGLINWSTGRPFVDPGEAPTWGWNTRSGRIIRRKILPGYWSLAKIVIGGALIYYGLRIPFDGAFLYLAQ